VKLKKLGFSAPLTLFRRWQSYHTFSKDLLKNDSIFLVEQVICSDLTRRMASIGACTLGAGFEGTPTHFAVK